MGLPFVCLFIFLDRKLFLMAVKISFELKLHPNKYQVELLTVHGKI
jgi:hypothetical protein